MLIEFIHRFTNGIAHILARAAYSMSDMHEWTRTTSEFISDAIVFNFLLNENNYLCLKKNQICFRTFYFIHKQYLSQDDKFFPHYNKRTNAIKRCLWNMSLEV